MPRVYLSPSTQEANIGKGDYGSEEKRMNEIADILEDLLIKQNITVYRNKPTMKYYQCTMESNNLKPDIHVAIHSDAGGGHGCTAYTSGSSKGRILANYLYQEVSAISPTEDRGVRITKDLNEVVKTNAIACLIEVSYHDNFDEARWIMNNIKAIATALFKGILKYFGIAPMVDLPDEGYTYRVVTGSFTNKEYAITRVKELEAAGFQSFIVPTIIRS